MRTFFLRILALTLLGWALAGARQLLFAQTAGSVLLTNATIHLGNGSVYPKGAVGFVNGKITLVSDNPASVKVTDFAEVIDLGGQHVYPALIAPNTGLGLVEVEAVRATRDFAEVGFFNPNIRSLIAFNTDSEILPTIRHNGVLFAQTVPQGGRISGQSSVVRLLAPNWEEAAVAADNGVHLHFPNRLSYTGWWAEPGRTQGNKNYARDIQAIQVYFDEAKAYAQRSKESVAAEKNLKFEVMRAVLSGQKKLFVHVNDGKSIVDAVEFCKGYGISPTIIGGTEAYLVADYLKQNNIGVILTELHALPALPDHDTDLPYKVPALLHAAGVKFALSIDGSWQTRNIAFQAGTAAAYGVPKEVALSAITGTAAELLGVSQQIGTLEVGKNASIVVSKGDIMDMTSSVVTRAYLDGKSLDLSDKQTKLYQKYLERYKLK